MEHTLYPFQRTGVDFLVNNKCALLADEMGLGKTIQAICAINHIRAAKILIVCPASLKLNWADEIKNWQSGISKTHIVGGKKAAVPHQKANWYIINYDILSAPKIFNQLTKMRFDVGVFDEAHYLQNRNAQRTRAVLLKHGIASRCRRKWFLTGTPILNRPIDLYTLLKACVPDLIKPYTTYTGFAKRYCGGYFDGYTFWDKGATHIDELATKIKPFMLRRLKTDVLKELPEKQYQIIRVPPVNQKVKELVAKVFNWEHRELGSNPDESEFENISLIRHALALSKVPMAIKHIETILRTEQKLVVFAHHRGVIRKLHDSLYQKGYWGFVIDGSTPTKHRHGYVKAFQSDSSIRLLIGHMTAAGVGITLTAARVVLFVEPSWVPGTLDQAIDRVHRIGQDKTVLVQLLVLADSMEEAMMRTVVKKKRIIKKLVDANAMS